MIYIAFYKKKRKIDSLKTAWYRLADTVTKIVTRGIYSHCEIAIDLGDGNFSCFSASIRDHGVRTKVMQLDPADWDLVDVSARVTPETITAFYAHTAGMKYDYVGLMAPVAGNWHDPRKYFCSEWCAEAVGLDRPFKISPVGLYLDAVRRV